MTRTTSIGAGKTVCACLLAGLLMNSPARADELEPTTKSEGSVFAVRGFGTLGFLHSTSDQAQFVRDLSQPRGPAGSWSAKTDSLLGVQGNLKLSERSEAVAQVVSRYGNAGNFRPELIWGFAKFDPNANWSLRAGRLGTDFYMLGDSRLIGYSYLTVRPPVDYFGTLPFAHIDGVDAAATVPTPDGVLRGKVFTGILDGKVPSVGKQWNLHGSRMTGGHFDYQSGDWLWRLGYAQLRFKKDIPIEPLLSALKAGASFGLAGAAVAIDELSVGGSLAKFYSAGMVYDHGPVQFQLMLSDIRQGSAIFQNTRSGYFIAGYRIREWTPFAGYSRAMSTSRHLPPTGMGSAMDATVVAVLAGAHTDQHTNFVGMRWDFQPSMALKAQFDAVRGTPQSVFPFQQLKPGWNGHTNVVSLTLDVVF